MSYPICKTRFNEWILNDEVRSFLSIREGQIEQKATFEHLSIKKSFIDHNYKLEEKKIVFLLIETNKQIIVVYTLD